MRALMRSFVRRLGRNGASTVATWPDGEPALVIGIPHPNSWGEKTSALDHAAESAQSWLLRNETSRRSMEQRFGPTKHSANWGSRSCNASAPGSTLAVNYQLSGQLSRCR